MANKFTGQTLFAIIFIAIAGIYLWTAFTVEGTGTCTQADVDNERHNCLAAGETFATTEFNPDADVEASTLWMVKLFIVGSAVFLGYIIVMKLAGGRPSRRDIASLVLLGVAVYFLWTQVIVPSNLLDATSFGALSLDQIGKAAALKMGVA